MSKKSPWNPGVFTTENLCGFHFSREGNTEKGKQLCADVHFLGFSVGIREQGSRCKGAGWTVTMQDLTLTIHSIYLQVKA